jgi:secondary thiamine-phosphate synthase enzyme
VNDIELTTSRPLEAIDVTERIASMMHPDGFVWIGCPHTTCALVICEADTDMLADLEKAAGRLFASMEPFAHRRNNNPNASAHLVSAFAGSQLLIPVSGGRMQLGAYQRLVFMELDGPKEHRIVRVGHLPGIEPGPASTDAVQTR